MAGRQESVVAYLCDAGDRQVMEEALAASKIPGVVRPGGVNAALDEAEDWSVVPEYLVMDVSGAEDPIQAIEALIEKSPEGETNLIVVGEHNDVSLYRRLKAIGVAEYMARPLSVTEFKTVVESVRRDRRDRRVDVDGSRLTVVVGVRGGAGCSTFASAIAQVVAYRHKLKTMLLDLDIELGMQYMAFNLEASPGMTTMFEERKRIDALFVERAISRMDKHLAIVSGFGAKSTIKCDDAAISQFVIEAHQGFEHVVVDLPARAAVGRRILKEAGAIVVVTTPTLTGLRDTMELLASLEQSNETRRKIVVINRVGEFNKGVVRANEFKKKIDATIVEIPFDPKYLAQAFTDPSAIIDGKGQLRKSLDFLADNLPTAPKREKKSVWKALLG